MRACNDMSVPGEQTYQDVGVDTYGADVGMNDYDLVDPAPVPLWRRRWVQLLVLAILLAIALWWWRSRRVANRKQEEKAAAAAK